MVAWLQSLLLQRQEASKRDVLRAPHLALLASRFHFCPLRKARLFKSGVQHSPP